MPFNNTQTQRFKTQPMPVAYTVINYLSRPLRKQTKLVQQVQKASFEGYPFVPLPVAREKERDLGPVSQKLRKLFGPTKPFLISCILKKK